MAGKKEFFKNFFSVDGSPVLSFWYKAEKNSTELVWSFTDCIKKFELIETRVDNDGEDSEGKYHLCSTCRVRIYSNSITCEICLGKNANRDDSFIYLTPSNEDSSSKQNAQSCRVTSVDDNGVVNYSFIAKTYFILMNSYLLFLKRCNLIRINIAAAQLSSFYRVTFYPKSP